MKIMENLEKYANNISRAFTTINTQLQIIKEYDSNLSESKDEDEA